jgi:hypothetical protein
MPSTTSKRRDKGTKPAPSSPPKKGHGVLARREPKPDPPPAIEPPEIEPYTRSEMRLIGRAVRGRWGMSEEDRLAVTARLIATAKNPDRSDKTAISAARALHALDTLNMEQERRDEGIPDVIENRVVIIQLPDNARDRGAQP